MSAGVIAHETTVRPFIPLLESGDRLTRDEFERRYRMMSRVKKAELIEEVVYLLSPVSKSHAELPQRINGWLFVYCAAHPRRTQRR